MEIEYQNPVVSFNFADPFVLRTTDGYYAYATASSGDERIFLTLKSSDLVHWTRLGGALEPLVDPPAVHYWAPEVAEKDGKFFLFYSATASTSDEHHCLRVATSDRPQGPFHDSRRLLMPDQGFSIDASPFLDPVSQKWFLYFATDFESDEPYGTGLCVAALTDDLMEIEGSPVTVLRAGGDWQIYERNREYKGRAWPKWHCVEGPSVVYHDGKYYCFYSGGAWHGPHYGVGYAVAEHPLGPWHDSNEGRGPTVLKAIEGKLIGPGHNSTVLGTDGRTLMMVYHAWNGERTARQMHIGPIQWTTLGPRVGPFNRSGR